MKQLEIINDAKTHSHCSVQEYINLTIPENMQTQEIYNKIVQLISQHLGKNVTKYELNSLILPWNILTEIIDDVLEQRDLLIKNSHYLYPYSLVHKKFNHSASHDHSLLDTVYSQSLVQASEIVREYTSANTKRAYAGDILYWQAWLSATGFDFKKPIGLVEITSFIIQNTQGLDPYLDKKLVAQKHKGKLGPHKIATVKRRLIALSLFLDREKLPNPCHDKEIKVLLNRLTKKHGESKPWGKAITRHILDDMLDTCGNTLIDMRDKALLLFAWASGGRRRSEVAHAHMKDLIKHQDGSFIYTIPKSKTDQAGRGHPVPIKGRAALALESWIKTARITDGYIFRAVAKGGVIRGKLDGIDIYRIVKNRAKKAGYDEKNFGAHGLRSGFVTEAGRRNKPLGDVMALTTHRNVTTVMKYYQAGNIIHNSAADLAD